MEGKVYNRREFIKVAGATSLTSVLISWASGPRYATGKEKVGLVTFRQDWIQGGQHAPLWVAYDKAWFAENYLSVQILRGFGSSDTAKRVGMGVEPIGQCDAGAVILTLGKGMKQKIVGTYNPIAPYCIACPKDRNIKTPKDLEGKTLAANPTDAAYIFWPAFVKKTGIHGDTIKINTVSPELLTRQLLSNSVDGVITYATGGAALAKSNNIDVSIIMYKDYGFDVYSNSITVHTPWLEQKGNEELLRRFLDVTYKGFKFSMLNPVEANAIVKKYCPESYLGEQEERFRYELLCAWAAHNITEENKNFGLGYMSDKKMKLTNDMTYEYKGMDQKLPLDTIYTNKYLSLVKLSSQEWQKVNNLYQDYTKLLNL